MSVAADGVQCGALCGFKCFVVCAFASVNSNRCTTKYSFFLNQLKIYFVPIAAVFFRFRHNSVHTLAKSVFLRRKYLNGINLACSDVFSKIHEKVILCLAMNWFVFKL